MKDRVILAGLGPILLLATACPAEVEVEHSTNTTLRMPFSLSGGCGSQGGSTSGDPQTSYSSSWIDAEQTACAVHAEWAGGLVDMAQVADAVDENTAEQPMTINAIEITGSQVTLTDYDLYLAAGQVATGLTAPGLRGQLDIEGERLLTLPLGAGRSLPYTVSFTASMLRAANHALRTETRLDAEGYADFTIAAADLQAIATAAAPAVAFSLDTDFTVSVRGTVPSF